VPIADIRPMTEVISVSTAQRRLTMIMLMIFAGVALILAAVGIYGVISYSVTQRTQEIGIRMALGAQRRQVLFFVLRNGLVIALLGMILGLAGALAATRYLEAMLFGLTPLDPITFLVVCALFIVVAVTACYLPARYATNVDPLVALRYE
jgi:putative ABC transport system permease protein